MCLVRNFSVCYPHIAMLGHISGRGINTQLELYHNNQPLYLCCYRLKLQVYFCLNQLLATHEIFIGVMNDSWIKVHTEFFFKEENVSE